MADLREVLLITPYAQGGPVDPVSVIVMALATGAGAVAQSAIGDAYAAVRDLLRRRFHAVGVDTLERDPASPARQEVVKDDLDKSGAAQDQEFLQLVERLVAAIKTSAQEHRPDGPAIDLKKVNAAELVIKKILAEGPQAGVLRAHDVNVGGTFHVEDVTIKRTEADPKE